MRVDYVMTDAAAARSTAAQLAPIREPIRGGRGHWRRTTLTQLGAVRRTASGWVVTVLEDARLDAPRRQTLTDAAVRTEPAQPQEDDGAT